MSSSNAGRSPRCARSTSSASSSCRATTTDLYTAAARTFPVAAILGPCEPPLGCDVVVVGAGSSGSVIAGRLAAETDASVVLVEAGPDYGARSSGDWPADLLDGGALVTSHDWGYASGELPGREPITFPRARVIGGCSAHNGCVVAVGARRTTTAGRRRPAIRDGLPMRSGPRSRERSSVSRCAPMRTTRSARSIASALTRPRARLDAGRRPRRPRRRDRLRHRAREHRRRSEGERCVRLHRPGTRATEPDDPRRCHV